MRPGLTVDILGFGEPELDANAALSELDKGLRSLKVGDQCEAIVRFPVLFERYPFPILINSAFLKLADVFRNGSNFLRLWILRVCQQSERHLDKILNIDEFVKKIFSVFHSNDPIARALSLRTLGSLSGLIAERSAVHHSIRVALDSHDRVEVSAAVYAASCFAQRSKTFGTTMCTKISSMVQRLSTPLDLKLRLIPIFQHMHHDVATVSTVRKLCEELLLNYPSENFVTTILHTMTRLSIATMSNLTEQVEFLLKHLNDLRLNVKLSVIQDLKLLGVNGGHLWESQHLSTLINSMLSHYSDRMDIDAENDINTQIVYTTLDVLNSLTSSFAILNFVYAQDTPLWNLLETSTQSSDVRIVLKAIQISTSITLNIKGNDLASTAGTRLVGLIKTGTESLLTLLCSDIPISNDPKKGEELRLQYLEKCLIYGTSFSNSSPYFCEWFCDTMGKLLQHEDLAGSRRNLICQSLGNIGKYNRGNLQKVLPNITNLLNSFGPEKLEEENSSAAVLVAIILQAHQGYSLGPNVKEILERIIASSNLWLGYRIARSSLRFGQPEIAVIALKNNASRVCSENLHFWLSSIHSIAVAESILTNPEIPLLNRLKQAINVYIQAVTSLKAASAPAASLEFQTEFVRLRCEMLVAFRGFLISCGNLQFSPPPAIAPNIVGGGAKDMLLASGRIVSQLRKSVREFYNLGESYEALYQTAFDSDEESLLNLQVLQQVSQLVGRAIEKIVIPKDHALRGIGDQAFTFSSEQNSIESSNCWLLIESCKNVVALLELLKGLPDKAVTQQHVDCLKEASRILIETPITYPRFFFQTLQTTKVKIAVSPQPRALGEHISVVIGNNLALKVEGVIDQSFSGSHTKENGPTRTGLKCFRKPKSIRITVISTPVPNSRTHTHGIDLKTNTEPTIVSKEAAPHKDFFTIQFLLGGWTVGITNLSIETSIIDTDGRQWITGPKATLTVKVYDETSSKSQSQPSNLANQSNLARAPPVSTSGLQPPPNTSMTSQAQIPGPSNQKSY